MPHIHHKTITALLAAALIFFSGAALFSGEPSSAQSSLLTSETSGGGTSEGATTGREILALLGDLKKISLKDSIFTDPVFLSLKDFRVTLPEQEKKRDNPFAPIGKDVLMTTTSGQAAPSPAPFSITR